MEFLFMFLSIVFMVLGSCSVVIYGLYMNRKTQKDKLFLIEQQMHIRRDFMQQALDKGLINSTQFLNALQAPAQRDQDY